MRAGRRVVMMMIVSCAAACGHPPDHAISWKDHVRVNGLEKYDSVWAYRTDNGEFQFSLGLTSPVHLLSYRDQASYPPFCRREQILGKLEALARSHGCDVATSDLAGAPTRLITCAISQPAGGTTCPSSYVAQIWQERWPDSTEDYELDMYARVRTVCAREQDFETFHASDQVTAVAEKQSDDVVQLLTACQTNPAVPGGTQ